MVGPELTFDGYDDDANEVNTELGEAASEAAGKCDGLFTSHERIRASDTAKRWVLLMLKD